MTNIRKFVYAYLYECHNFAAAHHIDPDEEGLHFSEALVLSP
jgi:hypothetical protein